MDWFLRSVRKEPDHAFCATSGVAPLQRERSAWEAGFEAGKVASLAEINRARQLASLIPLVTQNNGDFSAGYRRGWVDRDRRLPFPSEHASGAYGPSEIQERWIAGLNEKSTFDGAAGKLNFPLLPSEIIAECEANLRASTQPTERNRPMAEKVYWIVQGTAQDCALNAKRFDSFDAAQTHAKNVAPFLPGQKFVIFKAVGHTKVEQPSIWTEYEG